MAASFPDMKREIRASRRDWLLSIESVSKTTMPFEAPPAEARQCISCGDTRPLNFFGLDSSECRGCEALRRKRAMKQDADHSAEA